MENLPNVYMAGLATCGHKFCKRCLAQYASTCIEDRRCQIPCPQCAIPLSTKNVRRILNTVRNSFQLLEFYKKYIQDELVLKGKAVYCPNPRCEQVLRKRDSKINQHSSQTSSLFNRIAKNQVSGQNMQFLQIKKTQNSVLFCQSCQAKVCTSCYELRHDGLTCSEFSQLKGGCEVNTDMMLLYEMAEQLGYGQCPSCKSLIEKIDGCDHIVCQCGADFNIDRSAIRQGRYYERPLWMYKKDLETNTSDFDQDIDSQLDWLDVDIFNIHKDIIEEQFNQQEEQENLNEQMNSWE
eukprot:TRINITY_DN425_c0_g1_i7.p1 TRINITY_DN425_c0_g1~~TRINITY_DN425_c0_g1_i7.p1  ORF type:complete len:311 (-),score=20.12 TRINITY_DN425_c0_g1_i7:140-1021(-)